MTRSVFANAAQRRINRRNEKKRSLVKRAEEVVRLTKRIVSIGSSNSLSGKQVAELLDGLTHTNPIVVEAAVHGAARHLGVPILNVAVQMLAEFAQSPSVREAATEALKETP